MFESLRALFLASRPKTLIAGLAPLLVALKLAQTSEHPVRYWLVPFLFLSVLFIQVGTNLVNDWSDFEKGADTHQRLGPQRAAAMGWLSPRAVFLFAMLSFALAVVSAVPLLLVGGPMILLMGAASLIAGYAYTAGPYPLAYNGLGEVFVFCFFGLLAVTGSVWVLTDEWTWSALVSGALVGCFSCGLIAINNLRDVDEDRQSNKRTLAVVLGSSVFSWSLYIFLVVPFLYELWLVVESFDSKTKTTLYAAFLTLGAYAGFKLASTVRAQKPSKAYNKYLALNGALLLYFSLIFFFLR